MSSSRVVSRPVLLTAALALALPLAACGGDKSSDSTDEPKADAASAAFAKKSGPDIVEAAAAAMKKTGAVHLSGNMIQDGERLDIDLKADGDGLCEGELSTKDGGTATFVSAKDASYLKADDKFWEKNAGANAEQTQKFLDGKWAKLPASEQFSTLCGLGSNLFASEEDLDDENFEVGKLTELDGHPVVELISADGKEKYRMFVRADEPHQILKFVSETPGDPGEIAFDFEEKIAIEVPGADESVSLR
ncbi:hypothetical protein ABIE44_000052 [Marmoricola sp. OAE513]|uniref:hypothetical protein n=1 Tax=Marmoricola sp. OAE513 TaxID=2817894 RepID=UPI001AE4FB8A